MPKETKTFVNTTSETLPLRGPVKPRTVAPGESVELDDRTQMTNRRLISNGELVEKENDET